MRNSTGKILSYVLWAIMAVSVVFIVMFFNKNADIDTDLSFADQAKMFGPILDWIMNWTYLLFAIAALSAVLFPLLFLVKNPEKGKKFLVSIVIFAAVVLISHYGLASDEIVKFFGYEEFQMTPTITQWIGTGLYTTYIFSVLAIGAIFYTEIAKSFK